jgi:uncharacterized protein (DUF4415 family)
MKSDRATRRRPETVADDDIPEMTAADFRHAKPAVEIMPELIEAAKRARGRPRLANAKTHVSLRLDPEIVEAFKAEGPGWQGRINAALTRVIARKKKILAGAKKHSKTVMRRRKSA